jgi:hypothetical protein
MEGISVIFAEKRMNLFEVDETFCLAHCISSDCAMGAGIAVDFQKKFKLRDKLLSLSDEERQYPTCIRVDRVFNLITKKVYHGKPTYETVRKSLVLMREIAIRDGIRKIAMPKIASGLDRLSWGKVREIIKEVFSNTEIEIWVCSI